MLAGRRGAAGIGQANKKRVKSLPQSRVRPATQTKDNKEEAGTRPAAGSQNGHRRVNEIHQNYTLSEEEAVTRAVPLQNDTLVYYLPLKNAF